MNDDGLAVVKFTDAGDVQMKRAALEAIVREWVKGV